MNKCSMWLIRFHGRAALIPGVQKNRVQSTKREFIQEDSRERNIRPVVEDAKDFIIETLAEHKETELDELAAASSISKNAMRDAKAVLKKEGVTKVWSIGYGSSKKFFISLKDPEKINK